MPAAVHTLAHIPGWLSVLRGAFVVSSARVMYLFSTGSPTLARNPAARGI